MKISRRKFFQTAGAGSAALGINAVVPFSSCAASKTEAPDDEQVLFIGDDIAIADTVYGKVKGYILRGTYVFLGIPYGADTSGKNRFMPPRKPEPWTDIRPAVWYGNSAPQPMENRYANAYSSFADHWHYDDVSEDCLRLNIWTPAVKDGKKRPVIVWLHGGGYVAGNGVEQDGYNGENLSREGDIVFCSLNHRLGTLGFSDLSAVGGEKYASSGNVGILDIIAALRWVHDNIENFGGDPGNVTIMGQSGGGAKVCTVASMPAAKGLVHKAVALSGTSLSGLDQNFSRKVGEYILKEAGLKPSEVDKLQDIPWNDYIKLANSARDKARKDFAENGKNMGSFAPVADGIHIPEGEFFSDPSAYSASIPLMICSTFHEWNMTRTQPELENMTLAEAKERLKGMLGEEKANKAVDAYAKLFPDKKPSEICALVMSSRTRTVQTADAKAKQPAPVYMAWFGWEPPLFNNRMRAFHCLDICFWFRNTDVMLTHTGGGARPRKLSRKMSDALLNFMRVGDPNGGALPLWPKYTSENGEVMILNDSCEVKNDPDREARKALDGPFA